MNRIFYFLTILIIPATLFFSCIDEPPVLPGLVKSGLIIVSKPDSAVIYINNREKEFATPGKVEELEPGFYKIDLKKYAYIDTTIFYILARGVEDTLNIGLREDPPFWWSVFNMQNSQIPTNIIGKIAKDKPGNLWIGTSISGLLKFDGNSFTVFNTSNSGIASNVIRSIFIDNENILWIATNEGVSRFDGSVWVNFNASGSGWPDQDIASFTIDKNRTMWIGTVNSGLIKFDGVSFTIFNTENSPLPSNFVSALAVDSSNNLLVGTWGNGLAVYNNDNWIRYTTFNSSLSNSFISDILVHPDGNVWLATGSAISFGGLSKLSGVQFTNYMLFPVNNSRMATGIDLDHKGNLWLSTSNGIVMFNGSEWIVYNTENSGLPSNGTTDILVDSEFNKWVGTDFGLAKYTGQKK